MSQFSLILPGGSASQVVQHDLGTTAPDVRLYQRTDDPPWTLVDGTFYELTIPALGSGSADPARVVIRFPFVIPADTYRMVISNEAAPVLPSYGAGEGGSQLGDFLALAQSGQEMSLQSLWPVTLIFPGQGNAGGYAASGGPLTSDFAPQPDGTLIAEYRRSFRVLASSLAADGVVVAAEQTHVRADGKTFRVESVNSISVDGCQHIVAKQL